MWGYKSSSLVEKCMEEQSLRGETNNTEWEAIRATLRSRN